MINYSKVSTTSTRIKSSVILFLCFFLPLSKIVSSYLIVFIVLLWLLEGKFIERFKLIVSDKKRVFLFSLSTLYFLYLIGLIFTKNFTYAGFDLQVKLTLFIFPLVFSTMDYKFYTNEKISDCTLVFTDGLLFNIIISLAFATYYFLFKDHNTGHFLYAELSGTLGFHPTYLAMYLNFGIAVILSLINSESYNINRGKRNFLLINVVLFSIIIILLSSKAGIISMLITYLIFIVYLIIKQKRLKLGVILLTAIIISCFGIFTIVPSSLNRLKVAFEVASKYNSETKEEGESTMNRILIWKASTEIIKENFLTGVGTGDVKDALLSKYKEKNLMSLYNCKLNAHNQFLQTFISIGIIGFLTLLASIIIPLIYAIKRNNMIYVFFLIIFFINILVESMLENQAGVVFYAFFSSFLLMVSFKKTITD